MIARLLIVSHVTHYSWNDSLFAVGGYAREIDIWADLFDEVVIAAPCRNEVPPPDCLAFSRPNISMDPQKETGGLTWRAKATQIAAVPGLVWSLTRAMRRADAIHVRCPGNLAVLGVVLAPMLSRYIVAKHASQWMGYKGEPLSEQFQRYVLGSWLWRRGVVTVYGRWPDQPKQIVPFFTSMMTERQVEDAARVAAMKQLGSPIRILFAGRVEKVKGVDVLLRAAHLLAQGGLPFEITIVGDGSQCAALASLSEELGIAGSVRFEGAVPYDSMMPWYEYAHVLVLPSKHSEGWPKVLAEAMCHGVVCIGTDHGLVPWMLDGKGYVVPVDDVPALARCIERIAGEPDEYLRLSRNATLWARQYSLEALRTALRDLLSGRWQTAIGCRDAVSTGTGK